MNTDSEVESEDKRQWALVQPKKPSKRDEIIKHLKEENRKLTEQVARLIQQNEEQQRTNQLQLVRINELEAAANDRHGQMLAHFETLNRKIDNKQQETGMETDTTVQASKRAASDDESNPTNQAKKKPTTKQTRSQPADEAKPQNESGASTSKQVSKPTDTTNDDISCSQGPATERRQTREDKIPPVILHKQQRWDPISTKLAEKKISYTKARLIAGQIQIEPTTVDDHRHLTRFLSDTKEEYHTYSLPSERQLRVVMRGVPDGTPAERIKQDLENQGFQVQEALRMTSRKTGQVMPLILIKVPPTQEDILKVTKCNNLVVRV